jgi:hypothetical protein
VPDSGTPNHANTAYVDAVMHGRVHPFGHREHVQLAYVLVAEYGVEDAARRAGEILSHMAAAHGAPERFHVTMTVAWVRAVSHHMSEAPDVSDFGGLLERFPQLLRQDLLDAHYSRDVMFSDEARQAEVSPDRRPIPG